MVKPPQVEARAKEVGAKFKLVIREGKDHGWPTMLDDTKILADWFDEHLKPTGK